MTNENRMSDKPAKDEELRSLWYEGLSAAEQRTLARKLEQSAHSAVPAALRQELIDLPFADSAAKSRGHSRANRYMRPLIIGPAVAAVALLIAFFPGRREHVMSTERRALLAEKYLEGIVRTSPKDDIFDADVVRLGGL